MNKQIDNNSSKEEILCFVSSQLKQNDMWEQRALSMFKPVNEAMAWLRDEDLIDISPSEFNEFLKLQRVIYLSDETKFPCLPKDIRESVSRYLETLPGYNKELDIKQPQTTIEHHGYLEMQLSKILEAA
jgi:hypothetical protein